MTTLELVGITVLTSRVSPSRARATIFPLGVDPLLSAPPPTRGVVEVPPRDVYTLVVTVFPLGAETVTPPLPPLAESGGVAVTEGGGRATPGLAVVVDVSFSLSY